MSRARVSRLSWVRFFPEDFLGGTQQMDCRQVGQYILALCAQWGAERGAERTGLRTSNGSLKATLRGEELDQCVRDKFQSVQLPAGDFLRNKRMSLEIAESLAEWESRVRGAERSAERTAQRTTTTLTTTTTEQQPTERIPAPTTARATKTPRTRGKIPLESAGAVAEGCEDWTEILGGVAPGGRIAASWPPLLKLARWSEVRLVWRWYLEQGKTAGKAEFLKPADFSERYAYWRGRSLGVIQAPGRGGQPEGGILEQSKRVYLRMKAEQEAKLGKS